LSLLASFEASFSTAEGAEAEDFFLRAGATVAASPFEILDFEAEAFLPPTSVAFLRLLRFLFEGGNGDSRSAVICSPVPVALRRRDGVVPMSAPHRLPMIYTLDRVE
jgi:hypothetical protein